MKEKEKWTYNFGPNVIGGSDSIEVKDSVFFESLCNDLFPILPSLGHSHQVLGRAFTAWEKMVYQHHFIYTEHNLFLKGNLRKLVSSYSA
jgi:hypothetical protein